jgi:TPR repeat protein
MKKLTIALLLFTLSAFTSWAGDFQKGVNAYESGDYTTALKEFAALAEQGTAKAQYGLGFMYANGQGVPQDYQQAVKWYTKAAEQGHADAQYNLGFIYANGQGVPQDYQQAVKWYTKAVEQGYVAAQYNLGLMYTNGRGVPQDNVYAHMWFNLAAVDGDEDASKNRDIIAKRMTTEDLSKAQSLARECLKKNYKDC